MEIEKSNYDTKSKVREVEIGRLKIGGDTSISFMSENANETKPIFALEIPFFLEKNYPQILRDYWGNKNLTFPELFNKAQESECDMICIRFDVDEFELDKKLQTIFSELPNLCLNSNKPIILKGTGNKTIDKKLLAELAERITTPIIIAYAEEAYYEDLIPPVVRNNHILILRSPIDINLAKELNILSIDTGLSPEKILIDPDMGTLGYGLDYGYSIIEKIRQAAFDGDTMLNMPIITFVGAETFKAKEAKSSNFDEYWGEYNQRSIMWEVATASAIISAGSNVVVLFHPESIKTLKELLWN